MAFPWLNIDAECHKLMAATPRLKGRLDILTSIPGPGKITALVLLADMPELGSMDANHAASLAGFAPITRQSGQWRSKAFIQGGRATLRQANLYMPALVAIRFNHKGLGRFMRCALILEVVPKASTHPFLKSSRRCILISRLDSWLFAQLER